MIVTPKTRGFICTTAHPVGCEENVRTQIAYAKAHLTANGPKRVLVIGASAGYGLASRITAAFSYGADTIGVSFEKPASGKRTATAGWYNNVAFEKLAKEANHKAVSINGDAFSNEIKEETIKTISDTMPEGKVDLVVYSIASPRRTDPTTGEIYSSVIKPIGNTYHSKTIDFHTGEVSEVAVEPATKEEIDATVTVMGGEDWLLWIKALQENNMLAENAKTIVLSYIGPVLTHAVYKDGTIGQAKKDIEEKAKEITSLLAPINGRALVSVNKAVVTQSSSAIPVVPLYISLLFKIMKEQGTHENTIEQLVRTYERLYPADGVILTDEEGRMRLDDWEMEPKVQEEVTRLWDTLATETVKSSTDLAGYRRDFFNLFGFEVNGIDYEQPVNIEVE